MRGKAVSPDVRRDCGAEPWPPDGLERVPMCPVCGCSERTTIHRNLTDAIFRCAPGLWEMHRCDRCGTCYLDARPNAQKIHLAYGKYFTHADPRARQVGSLTGLRRLRRSFANGYRNWRYGTQEEPATALGIWAVSAFPRARRLVDAGMRFIPRGSSDRRLLDVGAGNGEYLLSIQSAGWKTVGVEPDAAAAAVAVRAGLDVRQGNIHSLESEPASFDVITMSHVIEHVHEPRAVLSEAFQLLRPGGILYLETPNIESYGHRRFGCHWRGLEPPRHLVLFNWSSLEEILRVIGFDVIKRRPRYGVYATQAAKSRAIARGEDPEKLRRTEALSWLADSFREVCMSVNHRRSEFITLVAQKR